MTEEVLLEKVTAQVTSKTFRSQPGRDVAGESQAKAVGQGLTPSRVAGTL